MVPTDAQIEELLDAMERQVRLRSDAKCFREQIYVWLETVPGNLNVSQIGIKEYRGDTVVEDLSASAKEIVGRGSVLALGMVGIEGHGPLTKATLATARIFINISTPDNRHYARHFKCSVKNGEVVVGERMEQQVLAYNGYAEHFFRSYRLALADKATEN